MEWFRMYHDARLDKKLQSLTDAQHRCWFHLLCFASEQKIRGTIPVKSSALLALEVAQGDTALLEETLIALENLDIIQRNAKKIILTHWKERQFASDSSTDRVRKHREQKKDPRKSPTATDSEGAESVAETPSNDDVTLPKRPVTPPDPDTDPDTDPDPDPDPDPDTDPDTDPRSTTTTTHARTEWARIQRLFEGLQ